MVEMAPSVIAIKAARLPAPTFTNAFITRIGDGVEEAVLAPRPIAVVHQR